MRRASQIFVPCLLFALVAACSRSDETLVVRKVLVDVAPGAEGPGGVLEREKTRALVHKGLEQDRRVRLEPDDPNGAILRVRLESATLLPASAESANAKGTLALAVEASGGLPKGTRRYHYRGYSVASSVGHVDFVAMLDQAMKDCLEQVLQAKGARNQPSETLLAWLDDEKRSEEQRLQAIRLLGARREAKAVPALIRILGGDDRELAQAALGALTLLGDPSAVDAVIEYAEGKPSLIRKQAIEAVRVMGTRKGMAWLFTLSTGHKDPDVQAAAAAALAQLEEREAEGEDERTRLAETAGDDAEKPAP